uniref:protein-histidine N-methyltransferase n=1 Tax=Heligmosomoides polygyrus TaxID=6339 RepID=A0A183GK27_HELPZ
LQEKLEIEKTQIASLQSEMKQKEDELQKQIALSSDQDKISKLGASEKEARNSLLELQAQLIVAEEKLKNVEKARAQEKYEEERIREQYANALENLKTELADAHNRINIAESAESECERLKNELEKVKKQCEDEAAKYKEETDSAIQDYKLKAEKKIAKIKAAAEKDVNSAKAEFLLEMDDLRRNLSERDRRVDELVVEKARTEQQLIGQQEMEKELEQRRLKEKELNDIRMSVERRIVELETANRLLEQKNAELVEFKEKSEARAEESEKDMKELQSQIQHLQSVNEEGFRKAVAKQDSDNKKYEEELDSMRRKLKECHREVDGLREANTRLERLLEQNGPRNNSPAVINVNGGGLHDGLGFADPAEAEYLKNVLYRYMYSRENLGKEAVTLARVIGTVAKFSKSEMDNVITREESRVADCMPLKVSDTELLWADDELIWECCYDLCELVDSESANILGKRVLELGCGAGLPGILCSLRGAGHVTLHDFNDCVIQCFTKENLRLNGVEESKFDLMSGPWTDFQSTVKPLSYDIIMTSETIYNPDDYEALHDAFSHALSPSGVIWVAAKVFYFGVGGDIPTFIEFVEKKRVFKVTTKQSIAADVPRAILELQKLR